MSCYIPKVCVVSTIKNPHQLETWIQYHLNLGVDYIYLFFDTKNIPNDSINICNKFKTNVIPFICNPQFINIQKNILLNNPITSSLASSFFKSYNNEVMSRQIINVLYANILMIKNNIDWLIHIDADELLYSKSNKNIKESLNVMTNKGYNYLKFVNYELTPEHENYENCFLEGNFFKKPNGYKFIAYANGKSGINIKNLGLICPNGVHEFKTKEKQYTCDDIILLHFVSCNFNEFLLKYKTLGNFNDFWWTNIPINISFHKNARDQIIKCNKSKKECEDQALNFYKTNNILDRKNLINNDNITQITNIKKILNNPLQFNCD